jgi:hypothetical protein
LKKTRPPATRQRLGLKKTRLPPARQHLGRKKTRLPAAGEHLGQKKERLGFKKARLPATRQHLGSKKKRLPAGRQLVYQENDIVRSTEEARMTVSLKRILVAVYPPENASALVVLAKAIVERMDGNPYFPHPVPPLAQVKIATDVLREAEAVSQSGMRGTKEVRNAAHRDLRSLLTRLKAYVQGVADDHPENAVAIIESAGMSVQPKGPKAKPTLAARNGRTQGTVLLTAKAVAKVATYHWQMSEDECKTWIDLPKTMQAKTKVSNLVPGRTYWFRFRALTRRGLTDWSDPVSIIVQ